MNEIVSSEHDFVVALERNSCTHKEIQTGQGHFIYENRLIIYGTGKYWDLLAYRFEDLSMRSVEIYDKYNVKEEKGKEAKDMGRAEHIRVLSSMNIGPREIYRRYNDRCSIENFFDTSKNDLGRDATHLRSDPRLMGYNFVTFPAFCI